MRRFLIVPLLVLLKFAFFSFFGFSWLLFDPLLALVVIYTFFHSMDMREYLPYALFCGLGQDIFSLDLFGVHMLSYLAASFCVAVASRIIYRHNQIFIFPMVFAAVLLNNSLIFFLKILLPGAMPPVFSGLFLFRCFLEAAGTTLLVYLLYPFLQKCVSGFTE
jgi:rod shape-determining protein MreD